MPKRPLLRAGLLAASACLAWAEPGDAALELKKMSIEELLDQQITTASRKAEPLVRAAAAIDVITSDQIQRSGVTTIPDALRLSVGMHVARFNNRSWNIATRGFNTTAANKVQAFMDGRVLYTPLYSGVYWDVQDYLLDDIDRIEVIRGPSGALWGANAFNGMINIITKSARDTQGTLINAGIGTEEQGFGGLRYGGQLGENSFYRVYAKAFHRDSLRLSNGDHEQDRKVMGQTGFRIDSNLNPQNTVTTQGDYYEGRLGLAGERDSVVNGGNFLSRWTHRFDEAADLQVQAYYDRTHRDIESQFEQNLDTLDLDTQYRRTLNDRNEIMAGFNYRYYDDTIENQSPFFAFEPIERHQQLVGGFVRYELQIVPERFGVAVGTKLEHNDFSGFEWQPGIRAAWTPGDANTVWAGISRALRTPTRFESDLRFPAFFNLVPTHGDFEPEEVIAYEIGWRHKMSDRALFDVSLYYNEYDKLRGIQMRPDGTSVLANRLEGDGYGVETGVRFEVTDWWRLRAGVTAQDKFLKARSGPPDPFNGAVEGNDPNYMARLHSSWDLPHHLFLDAMVRYVSELPNPRVDGYLEADLRLAWRPRPNLEIAIAGFNLLDAQHREFAYVGALGEEVERSGHIELTWSF